jgi:catechol 2,3-dioxygenase-like lactoylglutathione lyase family enzyme
MRFRIEHVQLAIPPGGEDLADTFYVGLLGFRVLEKPPTLAKRGGRWYDHGGTELHLGVETSFVPAKKAHVALEVDDYDELLASLRSHAVTVTPDTEIEGVTRCYVHDPHGNRLELIKAAGQ